VSDDPDWVRTVLVKMEPHVTFVGTQDSDEGLTDEEKIGGSDF
jgi:hypothetical protein